jgi:hypothetical protein
VSGRQMLTGRSLCASRTMKVKGLAMRPTLLGAKSVAMRSTVGVRASGSERAGSGAPGVEPSLREQRISSCEAVGFAGRETHLRSHTRQ